MNRLPITIFDEKFVSPNASEIKCAKIVFYFQRFIISFQSWWIDVDYGGIFPSIGFMIFIGYRHP